jgi:mRNA-degrading endonuclease toxin of MazEF toxin-antitoxin module
MSKRVRLVLIVSTNAFNRSPSRLIFVLPLTRTDRGNPLHIAINPPEGGVRRSCPVRRPALDFLGRSGAPVGCF